MDFERGIQRFVLIHKICTYFNYFLHLLTEYEGPGQKSPDYRASDAEGTLKSRIKIAHTR